MSEFLTAFENNFTLKAQLRQPRIKSFFTILNLQPAPRDGFAEIIDSRIWQMNVYEGHYFNNFIKPNLANDILKRAIISGMSGGSWRFKRFDRLFITANSDELRSIGKYKYF